MIFSFSANFRTQKSELRKYLMAGDCLFIAGDSFTAGESVLSPAFNETPVNAAIDAEQTFKYRGTLKIIELKTISFQLDVS